MALGARQHRRIRALSQQVGVLQVASVAGAAATKKQTSQPQPTSLAGQKLVHPNDVGLDEEPLESLKNLARAPVNSGRWPHAVTLVARRGKICMLDVHVGSREMGSKEEKDGPIDCERSLFRLFSQTKPIVAAATMALMDQGKLTLDDPLSKHLPEFKDAENRGWPTVPVFTEGPKAEVREAETPPTVRDLLMHQAGILALDTNGLIMGSVETEGWKEAGLSDRLRIFSENVAKLPLLCDPGADIMYSIQFGILGRLLEVVGGGTLEEVLQATIFDPCGMDSTFFFIPKDRRKDQRRCYAPAQRGSGTNLDDVSDQSAWFKVYTEEGMGYCDGSEGLVSSVADYYRFASMLLNKGVSEFTKKRVLSEQAVKEMTRNQIPENGDMSYMPSASTMGLTQSGFGLGVSVRLTPSSGGICGIGEYGWGGAANTKYWASPQDGNLLVLFFTQVLQDPLNGRITQDLHRNVYRSVVDHTEREQAWTAWETEERIDPEDGEKLTWEQLKERYEGKYSDQELSSYWEEEMTPVSKD